MKNTFYDDFNNYISENNPTFYNNIMTLSPKETEYFKKSLNDFQKISLLMEIIGEKSSIQESNFFLPEINQLLKRILHVLTLNDQYILDVFFRTISESLLRLIIFNSPQNNLSLRKIQTLSFTSIKKIVTLDSFLYSRKKQFIYLYDLFSTCSKSLHDPSENIEKIQVLDDQFTIRLNYKMLNSRIHQLLLIYLNYIIDAYQIHDSDISLAHHIKINKTMNNSEKNILLHLPK